MSSVAAVAAALAAVDPCRGPCSADAAVFHAVVRVAARAAARRPVALATSVSAREATAALVTMAEDAVEAGAGAWDAEEMVTNLAYLVGAMTEKKNADEGYGVEKKGDTRNANAASEEEEATIETAVSAVSCLLYTSPSPRDATLSRMPSSA